MVLYYFHSFSEDLGQLKTQTQKFLLDANFVFQQSLSRDEQQSRLSDCQQLKKKLKFYKV